MEKMTEKQTKIGKFIYRICIDNNIKLKEMAKSLNCSRVFLWMIMSNKRNLNDKFIRKLVTVYHLTEEEERTLNRLSIESRTSLHLNMTRLTNEKKELAILLNDKLPYLTENQIEAIRRALSAS